MKHIYFIEIYDSDLQGKMNKKIINLKKIQDFMILI